MNIHDNWRKFLAEGTYNEEKTGIMREATQEEYEAAGMGEAVELPPEELAFNDLFEGRRRIIIPLAAPDPDSDMSQFISAITPGWEDNEMWAPDLASGQMFRDKPLTPEDQAKMIDALAFGRGWNEPKRVKQTMKIGKWLSSVERAVKDAVEYWVALMSRGWDESKLEVEMVNKFHKKTQGSHQFTSCRNILGRPSAPVIGCAADQISQK